MSNGRNRALGVVGIIAGSIFIHNANAGTSENPKLHPWEEKFVFSAEGGQIG